MPPTRPEASRRPRRRHGAWRALRTPALGGVLLALLVSPLAVTTVEAADINVIVVDTTIDEASSEDGVTSLREAINQANQTPEPDRIRFAFVDESTPVDGRHELVVTDFLPTITSPVGIEGDGDGDGVGDVRLVDGRPAGLSAALLLGDGSGGSVFRDLELDGFDNDAVDIDVSGTVLLDGIEVVIRGDAEVSFPRLLQVRHPEAEVTLTDSHLRDVRIGIGGVNGGSLLVQGSTSAANRSSRDLVTVFGGEVTIEDSSLSGTAFVTDGALLTLRRTSISSSSQPVRSRFGRVRLESSDLTGGSSAVLFADVPPGARVAAGRTLPSTHGFSSDGRNTYIGGEGNDPFRFEVATPDVSVSIVETPQQAQARVEVTGVAVSGAGEQVELVVGSTGTNSQEFCTGPGAFRERGLAELVLDESGSGVADVVLDTEELFEGEMLRAYVNAPSSPGSGDRLPVFSGCRAVGPAVAEPSPSGSVSASPTESVSASPSGSVSASPTESVSASPTESVSASPTESVDPSPSGSVFASPTESVDPDPVDTTARDTAEELAAGLARLDLSLPSLLAAYDVDGDLAMVTGLLAQLYRLDERTVTDALALPEIDLDALDPETVTVAQLEGLLEAQQCQVADATADRILQATCSRTIDLTPDPEVDPFGADPSFLEDLGGTDGLGITGAWDGELTLTLTFGVDRLGDVPAFYMLGTSRAVLDVSGIRMLTPPADGPYSVAGAVEAGLQAVLRADVEEDARLRTADLATPPVLTVAGTAAADVTLGFPDGSVTWSADYALAGTEVSLTAESLAGFLDLPAFAGSGDTPRLELTGTHLATGWRVVGGLTETADLAFTGLDVTDLDVDLLATDAGVTGDVLGRVLVAVGDTTVPVDLALQLLDTGYLVTGQTEEVDLDLFGQAVRISDATLGVVGSVAYGAGEAEVAATLRGGVLTTLDGAVVVDGFQVDLESDGSFEVAAEDVDLDFGDGTVILELGDVTLSLGPDATGPLLSVTTVTGRIPALAGLVVTATDLVVRRSGRFEVGSITAALDDLPDLTVGGLLPFDLDSLEVTIDPETFDVDLEVSGSFDLSIFDGLPFTPVLEVGEQTVEELTNDFAFGAVIDSGLLLPTDLGEITLGWSDLAIGGALVDGEVRFGGIEGGVPVLDLGGGFTLSGPGFPGGGIGLDLGGTLPEVSGDPLRLDGALTLPELDFEAFSLSGLSGSGGLSIRITDGLLDLRPALGGISVERLEVPFGDLLTATAGDVEIDLLPGPGRPLITFGDAGLGLRFDDLDVLTGWGGTISNFAIGPDFAPYALPGFSVDIEVPDGFGLGLPDWLPFEVEEVGFELALDDLEGALPGAFEITDLADFTLRFSGGLNVVRGEGGEVLFPIDARVDGLELDLGRLVRGELPVTNLDGFGIGVAPFELGGVSIGGQLELGTLDVALADDGTETVLYGRVTGTFAMDGIGAGVDLVITEHGPVIAEAMAPAGIPLDPTGLVLASVQGGLVFGAGSLPDPDPDDPLSLLTLPEFNEFGDREVTIETIEELVRPAVLAAVPTWDTGAQLSVTGTLTHLAAPVVTGDVTLGAAYGADGDLDVLMKGDVSVYGLPFGEAGIRLVVTGPQAPAFQFAFAAPPPSSPLAFLMPVSVDLAGFLGLEGLAEGTVAALRTVVDRTVAGSLGAGGAAIDQAVTDLALSLDADRLGALGTGAQVRPLTRLLLDTDASGALTREEREVPLTRARVLTRLVALLPADPGDVDAAGAATLATAVLAELSAAAADPDAGAAAQAQAAQLLLDLGDVMRQALQAAGDAFLDVADPVLALDGAIQPTILGIPLGSPTDEVGLRIRKDGVSLRLTTSFNELVNRMIELSTLGLGTIYTDTIGKILTDQVTVVARFPVESALRALLAGDDYPAEGAATSEWGVSIEGSLGLYGVQLAELSGLLVPPGNEAFIKDHTQPLYDGQVFDPADAARPTPILEKEHEENLLAAGGLVLTGNLRAPRMVTDPAGLLADLRLTPPTDPLQLPAFLDTLTRELTREESPGLVQMYFPPPAELGRAHLAGLWDAKVLSVPLTQGRLDLSQDGLRVQGGVPLLGADAAFTIDEPVARADGGSGLPRVSALVTLDSDAAAATLADLGVPAGMLPKDLAEVRVRAFSPGFDPRATLPDGTPDHLRRTGGLEVVTALRVPGLVESVDVRMAVALGPDGLPASVVGEASIAGAGFGPVVIDSARLRIALGAGTATVTVNGAGRIFGTTVGVAGSLDATGRGSLALALGSTGLDLGGFRLTGSLVAVRDTVGTRVSVDGRLALPAWLATAGGSASVDVTGSISSAGNASLALSIRQLAFDRLRLSGTLSLTVTGGVARVSIANGSIRIPGTDRDVAVAGSLDSQGLGSLTLGTTGVLRFTGRPFSLGGTFTLAREVVAGTTRTRLRASNATFGWDGLGSFTATLFEVASDGSAAVSLPSRSLPLPGGGTLALGSLAFAMGPGASNPRLALGESRLTVPGLAERECLRQTSFGLCQTFGVDRRLVVPAFEVTTGDFTRTLADGSVRLGGAVSVSGRLVLSKTGDVWTVRVLDPTGGGRAQVVLGTLATVRIDAFTISSNGAFDVAVSVPVLGTSQLGLRDASLRMVRQPGVAGVFTLTATGGRLVAPTGTLATLPSISLTADLTFDRTVRLGLDWGPALSIDPADYRFRLGSDGVLRVDLPSGSRPTARALAGSTSVRLESLDLRSSGLFDLDLSGRIAFFGFRIANVDMDANLRNGVLRLAVDDARIDLGFASVEVSGFWESTGAFSLSGSFRAEVGACPVGCLEGGIATTISSTGGIDGDFDGRVCLGGGCASTDGSMSSSGLVTGFVRIFDVRQGFEFQIGEAPEDTIRPTFSPNPPPNVTVNQDVAGGEGRVSYELPSATDRRDATSASFAAPVTCSPAPGSVFRVGTTTVSCTTRDAAGNTRSATFTLTLNDSSPDVPIINTALAGGTTRTSGTGFAGGTTFRALVFSEPRLLATGTVPEDGVVDLEVTLPTALPPGVHTVVLSGTAPDGGTLVHAERIRVAGSVEPLVRLRAGRRAFQGRVSVPDRGCLDDARVVLVRTTRGRSEAVDRAAPEAVRRAAGRAARFRFDVDVTRPGSYRAELRRSDCEAVSRTVTITRADRRRGASSQEAALGRQARETGA